jgi:predicted DNA-binding transcriptional regulator AlpA
MGGKSKHEILKIEPLTYLPEEVQQLLGMSKHQYARAVAAGRIPGEMGFGPWQRRFSKNVIDTWLKYAGEDKNVLDTIENTLARLEEEA